MIRARSSRLDHKLCRQHRLKDQTENISDFRLKGLSMGQGFLFGMFFVLLHFLVLGLREGRKQSRKQQLGRMRRKDGRKEVIGRAGRKEWRDSASVHSCAGNSVRNGAFCWPKKKKGNTIHQAGDNGLQQIGSCGHDMIFVSVVDDFGAPAEPTADQVA